MSRWVAVAHVEDVPPGQGRTFKVEGRELALFNDGGAFFAVDDACPHQGASLGEGTLHEGRVICPWHNWIYELRTGECRGVPGLEVGCYPVRCSGRAIEVSIPD